MWTMFENEEKQLREVRSKLEEFPIPNEQLNDAIQSGFLIANSEWRAKRQKRRKSLWTVAIAAVFLLAFITSIRVSPAFANAIASIPGMGKLVEYIQYDKGLQAIMDNDYYQTVHASQMKDGLTLTINGVILDESGIVISYTLEAPYSIEVLDYKKIELYHNGKVVPPGTVSYNNPNQRHENRKEDIIEVLFLAKQSFDTQDFVLELQLDNEKETAFSLPFTLPKEVKKGKVFALDKVVEVEGQKMTIQEITIYPLRVEVKVFFDEPNSMKILNFMDMRIEDEKGEVWSSIQNGTTGLGFSDNEQTFYLQSNYFEQPNKLYFKFNKMQALPKDESYLLVDLQKQEVIMQPSDGKIEVTKMTQNTIEARFPLAEEFGYFLFFTAENGDGQKVESNSSSSWRDEEYQYSSINFTKNYNESLLKVYFQAYPNYINGDISVEIK